MFSLSICTIDKSFYGKKLECPQLQIFTQSSASQVFGGTFVLSGGVAIPQIRRHSFAQIVFKNVKYNNIRQKIIILAAAATCAAVPNQLNYASIFIKRQNFHTDIIFSIGLEIYIVNSN